MNIIVILPTYNEKGNIDRVITVLQEKIFPTIKQHKLGILVVDDNSPDGTAEDVRRLMKKWKNLSLIQGKKQGLGAAYVRGMTYAIEKLKADVMFEMDADLSHDPKKIPEFIKKIDEGSDMVIGTRYSAGGSIPQNWGFHRKAFSIIGNLLVRTILLRFSIHDWTGGFRAIRKEVFLKEKHELSAFKGYTFQVSFLHKAVRDGFRIAEVPFNFTDRTMGNSKIAPTEYIIDLLKYVIIAKAKELIFGSFGKFLIVGGAGFIINAIFLRVLVEWFGWRPYTANLVGAAFAIFSNYNLNNIWTFKERRMQSISKYFFKMLHFYATSAFGVIFIQTGVIYVGVHYLFGARFYFIYFLVGTFFLLIWNFTIYSLFIWKKAHKTS